MGPQCPHCGAVYEWTCGELEEQVTAPRIYFCQACRGMFVLAPDEVEALQRRFRPVLAEVDQEDLLGEIEGLDAGDDLADACDDALEGLDADGPLLDLAQGPADDAPVHPGAAPGAVPAGPPGLRERVAVTAGPHAGAVGAVAVIDGDEATLRLEGTNACVRVPLRDLRREAP